MGQRDLEDGDVASVGDACGIGSVPRRGTRRSRCYTNGTVGAGAFVLTVIGFALLTLGGWLGGAIVFVHGMRVIDRER